MLHKPAQLVKPSVAIICFIPDYGHLQPLLKIGDALQEAGFHVKCYIADECRPLLNRFDFEFFALDSTVRFKKMKEMRRAFSRSTFFNSVCLYLHYLLMYPRVAAEAGNSASRMSRALLDQQPDLIVCDALWFTDWYARIAQSHGVNLIVNSFDGSLAYNQRPFVQTYGLTSAPRLVQSTVEAVSFVSRKLCATFYRLRYLRTWLELRDVRRRAAAQFDAAFARNDHPETCPKWLVVGTAKIEREQLGRTLRLQGADRHECPALAFRSFLPIPRELLNWIGESDRPTIYVSFGSAVDIDERFARAIYDGLRGLEAQILWSLPERQHSLLSGVPRAENVRLEAFVPQPEILALPKVKCFVTQGGPHSVQEALFGATPMLCIPFFVDQAYNSSVVERLGVGKRLWRKNVSARTVAEGVDQLLTDPDFHQRALAISRGLTSNEGGSVVARYATDQIKLRTSSRVRTERPSVAAEER
jgi:hypothetical protein